MESYDISVQRLGRPFKDRTMYKHPMRPHYAYVPQYPTFRRSPLSNLGSFGGLVRSFGMVLAVLLLLAPEMLGSIPHYWIQRVSWLAIGMILWPLAWGSISLILRYGAVVGWLVVAAVLYTKGIGASLPVALPSHQAIASAFERGHPYSSSVAGATPVHGDSRYNNGHNRLLDWYNSVAYNSSGAYGRSNISQPANVTQRSNTASVNAARPGSVDVVGDIRGWTYVNLSSPAPRIVRVRTRPSRTVVTRVDPVVPEIDYQALARRYQVSMSHSGPQSWAASRDNDSFYFGTAMAQKGRNWFGSAESSSMGGSSGAGIEAILGPVESVSNQIVDFTGIDGLTQHIDRIVSLARHR